MKCNRSFFRPGAGPCISILLSLLLAACTASVDSMTDDFNRGFTASAGEVPASGPSSAESEEGTDLSIYDAGFSESSMLVKRYTLSYYSTLCLKAPAEAATYIWTATATDGAGFTEAKPATITLGANQQLSLYVPASGLQKWTEYQLTLTVLSYEGMVYTDTATLVVVP